MRRHSGYTGHTLNTERPSRSERGKLQRRFREVVKKDV